MIIPKIKTTFATKFMNKILKSSRKMGKIGQNLEKLIKETLPGAYILCPTGTLEVYLKTTFAEKFTH